MWNHSRTGLKFRPAGEIFYKFRRSFDCVSSSCFQRNFSQRVLDVFQLVVRNTCNNFCIRVGCFCQFLVSLFDNGTLQLETLVPRVHIFLGHSEIGMSPVLSANLPSSKSKPPDLRSQDLTRMVKSTF